MTFFVADAAADLQIAVPGLIESGDWLSETKLQQRAEQKVVCPRPTDLRYRYCFIYGSNAF